MLVMERDGLKMTFQALQAKVSLTDTFGCSHSQIVTDFCRKKSANE